MKPARSRRSAAAVPISPPRAGRRPAGDKCEIYTDVDGVYTATARREDAKKLEEISYDEMLELASLGSKVMQTRSVEFAAKYGVCLKSAPLSTITQEPS